MGPESDYTTVVFNIYESGISININKVETVGMLLYDPYSCFILCDRLRSKIDSILKEDSHELLDSYRQYYGIGELKDSCHLDNLFNIYFDIYFLHKRYMETKPEDISIEEIKADVEDRLQEIVGQDWKDHFYFEFIEGDGSTYSLSLYHLDNWKKSNVSN